MKFNNVVKLTSVLIALFLLLTVNPAFAAEQENQTASGNEAVASMDKININQADAKTLTTLKGIGKDRALKIIEYREKNGPFQKIEDIMKVKGIGKKVFEQNKSVITV